MTHHGFFFVGENAIEQRLVGFGRGPAVPSSQNSFVVVLWHACGNSNGGDVLALSMYDTRCQTLLLYPHPSPLPTPCIESLRAHRHMSHMISCVLLWCDACVCRYMCTRSILVAYLCLFWFQRSNPAHTTDILYILYIPRASPPVDYSRSVLADRMPRLLQGTGLVDSRWPPRLKRSSFSFAQLFSRLLNSNGVKRIFIK